MNSKKRKTASTVSRSRSRSKPVLRVTVDGKDLDKVVAVRVPSYRVAVLTFRWYADNAPEELRKLVRILTVRGE